MNPELAAAQVADVRRAIDAQWNAACRAGPTTDRDLSIAGLDVRLRVVGDDLVRLMLPALAHHRPARAVPERLVGAWTAAPGALPLPKRADGVGLIQSVVKRDDVVVAQLEGESDSPTIRVADHVARRYLLGVEGVANLPPWEGGAPFRRQFHWALAPDALPVHAAAVGDAHGAALLVGRGGSGKSSTAVACLAAGLGFLGDDYSILRFAPEPVVHSLYCTAKVAHEEIPHVDALAEACDADVPRGQKAVLFPSRVYPERIVLSAPISAVMLPTIVAGTTEPVVEPASAAEALRALAPSSLVQMHLDAPRELGMLVQLVGTVPAYRLGLCADRAANAAMIAATLARLAGPVARRS